MPSNVIKQRAFLRRIQDYKIMAPSTIPSGTYDVAPILNISCSHMRVGPICYIEFIVEKHISFRELYIP